MRHHIDSVEFELFLNEFDREFLSDHPDEAIYDLWAEGYSSWEIELLLG